MSFFSILRDGYSSVRVFAFVVLAGLALGLPSSAFAADGSGTNTVLPASVTASSTGNTLNFTFTASEGMSSGGYTVVVPSGWSTPTSVAGTAGYTTVSSGAGLVANSLDRADSVVGWSAGSACSGSFSASSTVKVEGTSSIACVNGSESDGDKFYKNVAAQNWSTYTSVGFWVRSSVAVSANRLQFSYDNSANLTSPIASLNVPALLANTWTYVSLTLTGTRTSVASFGFIQAHSNNFDHMNLFVDDLLIGPGVPRFPGGNTVAVDLLNLASGQTVVLSYGSGGGSSGVVAPTTGRVSIFTTQSRTNDGGTYTAIVSSPTVTVNNPAPTLTTISPTTKNVGDGAFTLTLTGTGYNASSTVYFASDALVTTYVSSTQITAAVPGAELVTGGSINVTVVNPNPVGGTSVARVFSINNPAPTLTLIAPDSVGAGDSDTILTLTGSSFVNGSIVKLNGNSVSTVYNSPTQLTATIASSSLRIAGSYNVAVFNAEPGGGTSTNRVLTVNNVVPVLDGISPSVIEQGSADTVITLNGTALPNDYNFATNAVAKIDGDALVTTFVNPRRLTAIVPASYLVSSSTHNITVFNPTPGGGTSTPAILLRVSDTAPPVITITAPTKDSNVTITDTTIHVVNTSLLAANVIVDPSTTAGTSNFSCVQTSGSIVDCTISIVSSGHLVIRATDLAGLSNSLTEPTYRVDTVVPLVTITAPTLVSNTTIINTAIHVTDNYTILAANVSVDPSTTAGTSNFSCVQTNSTTVDCTIRVTSSGTLVIKGMDQTTNVTTQSQSGYIIEAVAPVVAVTAPTKIFNTDIANTAIHVTDNYAILASDVLIDPSTTVGNSGFSCVQTNASTVDCSLTITTSGSLVILATDRATNFSTQSEMGYVIESVAPVVTITAPTKTAHTTITDTTIHVTDNNAILAANVIVNGSTSVGTSDYHCVQTNALTVDCTIFITSSGELVIKATDQAANIQHGVMTDYFVEVVKPVIVITAPTTASSTSITNTTIRVTDNHAILATNVVIDPSTTVGNSGFSCIQSDTVTVDCIVTITSNGSLIVKATDDAGNIATSTKSGYIVESVAPVITITAPTKLSKTDIVNTTIHVTDNSAIMAANVAVDGATSAVTSDFSCVQTNGTTVDCTIKVNGSGDLVILARDVALNVATLSESGYVIDHVLPTVAITATTITSNATIKNTTIRVTDGYAISVANIVVATTTTAGTSNFNCIQTSGTIVDCTIWITSTGNLAIKATDNAGNARTDTQTGYIVESVSPVIVITAPTKAFGSDITDTTIHLTDNYAIASASVIVDPSSTVTAHDLVCTQTNSTTVDCAIHIDSSGSLTIKATDQAGNVATRTEAGYVITRLGPTINIVTPTKTFNSTITDTTIHVVDLFGVSSASVIVDPSTTAGTSGFSCTQTDLLTVDCTINITSSGDLAIQATNNGSNITLDTAVGYKIESTLPVVTITAPTKISNNDIDDTTIHITDNNAITMIHVVVDPSTTAVTHSFSCAQTNVTTVDCTIEVSGSGDLVIRATDHATNVATVSETGYIIDVDLPLIDIVASTKLASSTIMDTVIHVIDTSGISSASVVVDPASTATTSDLSCAQTDSSTVDCTIHIDSSGTLVVQATDLAGNLRTNMETGYSIESTPPVITITAPTKAALAAITDTVIHVTDNHAINAADIVVDAATTADTSAFVCVQTTATTVDCTIQVDTSGDITIYAVDGAGNTATLTESGYTIVTTGPVISDLAVTPADTSASITWMTDSLASSQVVYSADESYSFSSAILNTSPRVVSHMIGLTNLVACTFYHYKVTSVDAFGTSVTSTGETFTTTGCPGGIAPLLQTDQTIPITGGSVSLTYNSRGFVAQVPNGYSGLMASFQIAALDGAAALGDLGTPSGLLAGGGVVWHLHPMVDAENPLASSAGDVTITIGYTVNDVVGVDEDTLRIYHYTGGAWVALDSCMVNKSAKTLSCVTSSFSPFAIFGAASVVAPILGGGATPAEGYLLPRGPFSLALQGGGTVVGMSVAPLVLSASSDVNRMAISRYADFHDASIVPFASTASWSLCGFSECPAGAYDIYVKFYQAYGLASSAQHLGVTYTPGAVSSFNVSDLGGLLSGEVDDGILKLVRADAKEFNVSLTSEQELAIARFIKNGISPATIKFGQGERRAIMRDYLETVHRADVVWSDVERIANGQIPLTRNLAIERLRVVVALPAFRKVFGHDPTFKNATENLAWNTIMYRIRFARDLTKEAAGGASFKRLYKRSAASPFDWAIVRVLGYVR